jgi:hypothetical protein
MSSFVRNIMPFVMAGIPCLASSQLISIAVCKMTKKMIHTLDLP